MSSNITLPVGSEQEGQRIDKFLQESLPGMSRSQAQKWIVQGLVRIGEKGSRKKRQAKVRNGGFSRAAHPAGGAAPGAVGDEAFLNRVLQSNAVPESILLDADSLEVVKRTLLQDHALLLTMIDGTREALDIPISVFAGEKDILVPLDRVRLWRLFTTGVCSMATIPAGIFICGSGAER